MIRVLWATLCRAVLVGATLLFVASIAAVCIHIPWIAGLLVLAILWRRSRRGYSGGWSHGTGRFATVGELARRGMLGDEGLILGRVGYAATPSRWAAALGLIDPRVCSEIAVGQFLAAFFGSREVTDGMLRVRDYVHLATFSRTGGGKGVSVVIPNLRSYRGSTVTIDPKCENFKLTGEFRQKRFGHRIVRLDPALLGGPGADSFNPLAFIDPAAPDFLDCCRDVAAMLIKRQGTEPDPYWNDAAEMVLTAEIAFVCACEPDQKQINLETVRKLVSSRERFAGSVEIMRQTDNEVIRRVGSQLTWLADKELNGVLSSVGRHTAWMDSPAVAACMTANSFDPRTLRSGKVSVYLVMPPERLAGTWSPLMRVWLGSILRIVSRQGADEHREILFFLDEVAQLGRMQALEEATTIMRGYGIRLWFIFQSLGQVQECYGDKADVILDNIGTQQFFAVNSYKTAEEISKRLGDQTIQIASYNSNTSTSQQSGGGSGSQSQSMGRSSGGGYTTSELARLVLKPDEILTLPEDVALITHRNMHVTLAKLVKYYNAPEFSGRRGTGKRRGLGLAAGLLSTLVLAASMLFAMFVNGLSFPMLGPPMPGAYPARPAEYGSPWQAQVHDAWQSGVYNWFPELEPLQYRQQGFYAPPRRKQMRRRETNFNELIRIE